MTDSQVDGAGRLRGLVGKLRHPLPEVRRRAISNISGKLSLGLMRPGELESDPSFFPAVLTLLTRSAEELQPASHRGEARVSMEAYGGVSGPLLSLCAQLAKEPSCKARLAIQGAHVPLSKIANSLELPRELRALAAEALAMVEVSPGTGAVPATSSVMSAPGIVDLSSSHNDSTDREKNVKSTDTVDCSHGKGDVGDGHDDEAKAAGEALALKEACLVDGTVGASGQRWPRWTKDLVDGPSLRSKNASAETLVASLRAGWRFPPVRLIRSEESALFDFEVRFRTANNETSLLGCIERLRDEIMEDYPVEILLQRPGTIGRLAALLRTPSASERVLEEALSTSKRLLERLVSSTRVHLDDAFLPPGKTDGYAYGHGPSNKDGSLDIKNSNRDVINNITEFSRDSIPRAQRFVAENEAFLLRQGTGNENPLGPGPGEAAVATLLSFRYPQSSLSSRMFTNRPSQEAFSYRRAGAADGGHGIDHGGARARIRNSIPTMALAIGSESMGTLGESEEDAEGLSICGAVFALFLSVCPLLALGASSPSPSPSPGPGRGGERSGSSGGAEGGAERPGRGVVHFFSSCKVALYAAELLQFMMPLLLEPRHRAERKGSKITETGDHPRYFRLLDALRLQELLCSVGRILGDTATNTIGALGAAENVSVRERDGKERSQLGAVENQESRASSVPAHPAVSVALELMSVFEPSDFSGNSEDPLSLALPPEYASLVRSVAMDSVAAEEQPWLRDRLRPFLATSDPEGAAFLEEAQRLVRDAETVLDIDAGVIATADGQSKGDPWGWVAEQLRKVQRALPLVRTVDEPRIVGTALVLWSAAATAAAYSVFTEPSGGQGGIDSYTLGEKGHHSASTETAAAAAAAAEHIGAAIIFDIVRGSFGERACYQALCMLEELVGVKAAVQTGEIGVVIPSGLAAAMISRGLADPRLPPSSVSRSAAALAIFAGTDAGGNDDLGGEGLGEDHEDLPEGRATLDGHVSPATARSSSSTSMSLRATGAGARTALMASLLQRAAAALTDRSDARGKTPMTPPGKGAGNPAYSPYSLSSSPPSSTSDTVGINVYTSFIRGDNVVDGTGASNGKGGSGSDTAVSAVSARRVIGRSCAELCALLLSARKEVNGVMVDDRVGYNNSTWWRFDRARDAADSSADILTPLRENGTPHGRWRQQRQRHLRAGYAAAAFRLAPTLEAFLCCSCCDERVFKGDRSWQKSSPRMGHAVDDKGAVGNLAGLREACRAASDLLELLEEYPMDEEMWGAERGDGDGFVLSSVSRMLREVRGLCRDRVEDRVSASRRLADLLLRMPGGRAERTNNTPLVYTEDPLLPPLEAESPGTGKAGGATRRSPPTIATTTASLSIGAGVRVGGGRFSKLAAGFEGSEPHFTADHVKNLAEVAGSETLEDGLRRAAAEQLRAVLESRGVASAAAAAAVATTDAPLSGNGVRRGNEASSEDLSSAVLRAALSGFVMLPSPTGSLTPPASTPDVPTSSAAATATSARFATSTGSTSTPRASAPITHGHGHGHANDNNRNRHEWDEAFLGLLSVAVWKLPSARRALLTSRCISIHSRPVPSPGLRSADASFCKEIHAGETDTVVAVAAVLRRLYHPRPSVRRLAGRVAIRMAFDPPSMFSPLLVMMALPPPLPPSLRGVSTPCRSGYRSRGEGLGSGGTGVGCTIEGVQSGAVEERGRVRGRYGLDRDCTRGGDSGGDIERCSCLASDGLVVPFMVLEAYPRVGVWVAACSCRGDGGEAGNDLALVLTAANGEEGSGIAPRGDNAQGGREDSFYRSTGFGDTCNSRSLRLLWLGLAADEWRLLCRRRVQDQHQQQQQQQQGRIRQGFDKQELEQRWPQQRHREPEAVVAGRISEALGGASRRLEFSSAMAVARAWMLAGDNYKEAFFGRVEVWRSAFERFLQTPPRSVKDNVALRNVLAFLMEGVAWMCTRGLNILAAATEGCFIPILSGEWRPNALADISGDWKPPSRRETPKELEAKQRLQEAVLELLVEVISSPRLDTEAAGSLTVSSLPRVLWKEVLVFQESRGGSDWGLSEGRGNRSLKSRRLVITFLIGILRRCGAFAIPAWAGVAVRRPSATDGFGFRFGGGGNLFAVAEASAEFGDGQGASPTSVLLTELVKSLVRHASIHCSPDGFRGRASLTASLVALQSILAVAGDGVSPPNRTTPFRGSKEMGRFDVDVAMAEETLSLWGAVLSGVGGAERRGGDVIRTNRGPEGEEAKSETLRNEGQRLAWLLRLACHRDSSVRALAFSVLAEMAPSIASTWDMGINDGGGRYDGSNVGGEGVEEGEGGEVLRACLRAALDGSYESPASVTEALRFLSRHASTFSAGRRRRGGGGERVLPGYTLPLSASLCQAASSLLLMPARRGNNRCFCGDGHGRSTGVGSAAGSLSIAAAQLRFMAVAVASAGTAIGGAGAGGAGPRAGAGAKNIAIAAVASSENAIMETPTIGGGEGGEEREIGEGPRFPMSTAMSTCEGDRPRQTEAAGGYNGASVKVSAEGAAAALTGREVFPRDDSRGRHRGRQGGVEELGRWAAREFVELVEALWASGCLEACVHVLGETPGPMRYGGKPSGDVPSCACNSVKRRKGNRWVQLMIDSADREAAALRRAQADSLTLLRFVFRFTTLREASASPPPRPPRRQTSDSSSTPATQHENADANNFVENRGESGGTDAPTVRLAVSDAGAGGASVAQTSAAVRRAMLTNTPLLAGIVRCLVGAVESGSTASELLMTEMSSDVDLERARRELSDSARVAREGFSTLRCLLSVDAAHALETPLRRGGGGSMMAHPDPGKQKDRPRNQIASAFENSYPVGVPGPAYDVVSTLASDLLSPGSAIPQTVLAAVNDVLLWWCNDGPRDLERSQVADLVCQVKTEARRLLPVMLSLPRWRNTIDLASAEARSIATVLFQEESAAAAALSVGGSSSWDERSSARDLRALCLGPLLENSEYLQGLALSSGLIGNLYLALNNSLAEMAPAGHGRDTIKHASKYLETLKAGMMRRKLSRASGARVSPAVPAKAATTTTTVGASTYRSKKVKTKPPIPTSREEKKKQNRNQNQPRAAPGRPSSNTPPLKSSSSKRPSRLKLKTKGEAVTGAKMDHPDDNGDDGSGNNDYDDGGDKRRNPPQGSSSIKRRSTSTSQPQPQPQPSSSAPGNSSAAEATSKRDDHDGAKSGGEGPAGAGSALPSKAVSSRRIGSRVRSAAAAGAPAPVAGKGGPSPSAREEPGESKGKALEKEFYTSAALLSSAVGDFPDGQAECLRLQLPQLLWKAWPVALASQLSRNSSGGRGFLLQALLDMACALTIGFPQGKRAFIFAGPEGSNGGGPLEEGEWPKSSRTLLHRVAALALSGSPIGDGGSGGRNAGEPEYGRAPCEASCDVIRSCALSPECRTLLTQSGFFVDSVAQIRWLCGKAGNRPGSVTFSRTIRRVGDLTGVLVNASLRTEGQKALLQIDGIGDMVGDLLRLCLRATTAMEGFPGTAEEATADRGPGTGKRDLSTRPPAAIARVVLLLRNLALAPSTGEVAAHRQPLLDLAIKAVAHPDMALSRSAASCLRAVLRGSCNDGGGRTAVGVGPRKSEVATAVESRLMVSSSSRGSEDRGGIEMDPGEATLRLRMELQAVRELLF